MSIRFDMGLLSESTNLESGFVSGIPISIESSLYRKLNGIFLPDFSVQQYNNLPIYLDFTQCIAILLNNV